MSEIGTLLHSLVIGGAGNLAAYLAAHVVLCLLPAFFVAGAMSALIPRQAVTRFLGRDASKFLAYPAAAAAGSLLAVCSCTIVPLFAGIYRRGAGIGPAVTFLFFAPAANVLALVYTSAVIGPEFAFARFFLSLAFAIGIGLVMAALFRSDDAERLAATTEPFDADSAGDSRSGCVAFLLIGVAVLLAGTLKFTFLTDSYAQFDLSLAEAAAWQETLDRLVPHDPDRGEEGVSVHGALLIAALVVAAVLAWRGFDTIHRGFNGWTRAALLWIAAMLLFASLDIAADAQGLRVGITGKSLAIAAGLVLLRRWGARRLAPEQRLDWLWESWRFAKQIFPVLVVGVFIVGMARVVIRPEWIETLAGDNTLSGNLAGVAFGVFMYFPTLVEVPVARMFLDLGMHPGPLLAYLMADPELSLQSILIISAVVGRAKAWSYVALVALFSVTAGMVYGAWTDGASAISLALGLAGVATTLAAVLILADRRSSAHKEPDHAHD